MYCFIKCCRLCLTKNNTLANIKCIGSDGVPFLDKLGLLAPLLVVNPPDYKTWICEECRKKLNKAYSFIQHCYKIDAVLNEYCKLLTNADTVQNNFSDSNVSVDIQLTENMIKELIPISVKEECFEDLPAIDENQYYFESTITIEKHEVCPVDFEFIKVEPPELKEEASLTVGDASNEEIMVSGYNPDLIEKENVQIDPIAGTSNENNILYNRVDGFNPNSKKRWFTCVICNKTFTRLSSLKKHERVHTGERPFKCNTCNKTFSHSGNLRKHERIHTGELRYACKICKKKFAHSSNLKRHEAIHGDERPFECNICNKTFLESAYLKQHERVHTGERPYNCKICNKKFNHSGNLKEHERIHSGERPFDCKICYMKFASFNILKQHGKIHTGERRFECKICKKKFVRFGNLKEHQRVHSRERPYECNICKKKFISSSNLTGHGKVHSGDRS